MSSKSNGLDWLMLTRDIDLKVIHRHIEYKGWEILINILNPFIE